MNSHNLLVQFQNDFVDFKRFDNNKIQIKIVFIDVGLIFV